MTIIHAKFQKQPREIRSFDLLLGDELDLMNDAARAEDPVQLDTVPEGINVFALQWVAGERFMKFWVDDTSEEGRYQVTAWLWTAGGQRVEVDVLFVVKE